PGAERRIVEARGAPAFQRVAVTRQIGGGPAPALLGVEERAAGACNRKLEIVLRLIRKERADDSIVIGRGRNVRALLCERQRALADEVHLEAKEIVLRR